MHYDIIPTPKFQDDLRYYKRKKHYKRIQNDVDCVVEEIEKGNLIGNPIDDLHLPDGEDTYKVRAANTDTCQGKSNGYRIIYYVIKNDLTVYLLTIYSKKDDIKVISNKEIIDLIETYCK